MLPLLLACAAPPPPSAPPPAAPTSLADADAVAAADLDGDGVDEAILVHAGVARWSGREAPIPGVVQVVARGRLAGQAGEVALLGAGQGRGALDAPASLWALGPDGATELWSAAGERNQVTAVEVVDGRVWLAAYVDTWNVAGGWLSPGPDGAAWTWAPDTTAIMAIRQLPLTLADGRAAVALGRLYGDRPKSDGDLRVRVAGEDDRVLPTLRGVRALAAGDLDGDGAPELVVGDGWASAYGREGDPRIRVLRGPDWVEGRTIGWLEGEYTANELYVVGQDVLAVGSGAVTLLRRDDLGWGARALVEIREVDSAVPFRTATGPAVLVSGSPAKIVPY